MKYNTMPLTKKIYYLLGILLWLLLPFTYAQEEILETTKYPSAEESVEENSLDDDVDKERESLIEQYSAALLYGIDSSVLETIKSLTKLAIEGFETQVLERLQESNNSEIIVAGFRYLHTMEYKEASPFALEVIKNHKQHANRTVQYATFYIKDNPDTLSKEDITELNSSILKIIDSNIPSIALAATELIAAYYTEKDVAVVQSKETEEEAAMNDEAAINAAEGTKNATDDTIKEAYATDIDIEQLFSTKLKQRYDSTQIEVLKDQILLTLGQIQAKNQLDFIISIAENNLAAPNLRGRALESLANFEELSATQAEALDTVLESTKKSDIPAMRLATIKAIAVLLQQNENLEYLTWLQEGLRDSDIKVRTQVLKAYYDIFKVDITLSIDEHVFAALKYIIDKDPEITVQTEALNTIALYPSDKALEYILKKVANITRLNSIDKAIIDASLEENIVANGGADALVELIQTHRTKKESSIIEYIAKSLSETSRTVSGKTNGKTSKASNRKHNLADNGENSIKPTTEANTEPIEKTNTKSNESIILLVENLLPYRSSSVTLACLDIIARYKLEQFNGTLEALNSDITQTKEIRRKSEETLGILKK